MSDGYFVIASTGVLGRIELALGNLVAAGSHLRDLPRILLERGITDPANPVWADAIETLASLEEHGLAAEYLEVFAASAHRIQSPDAMAAAARCSGLLAASQGDLPKALTECERALVVLGGLTFPFERGRTMLVRGSVLRQLHQRGAARAVLEDALATFEGLGARLWADKVRAELRRISGRRPSAPQELTDTEFEVATLAASGRSNKEIAAAMHMGVSTVEAHLSHVYRKLGVHRAELATRLLTPRELSPRSP